ncbi:hypothetical protein [Novosphingobium sp.]|uniref:hypothetical protein n=1 Tax=Novosphingobium sp. TaxID=1874826 RepID=UPI001ECE0290|nr:hypothetical protein [Novosphingobium sp.]MBK6801629.1 hypothetical protein [Novosphingobium sp.]MBK9010003.1 hypothetical protein [Novosphingobium sp.]
MNIEHQGTDDLQTSDLIECLDILGEAADALVEHDATTASIFVSRARDVLTDALGMGIN